jgi:hypothetical protein
MNRLAPFAAAAAFAAFAMPANAQLATFDDLALCQQSEANNQVYLVPNGYAGFNWSNFYVGHGATTATRVNGPGYANGTVTDPCMALNGFGEPAEITSGNPFIFNGGFFTAAFQNGLFLSVEGFSGATLLFATSLTLNTAGPQLMDVTWAGVDRVRFQSGSGSPGSQFVFDNFRFNNTPDPSIPPTTVPEPGALLLLATGLAGLAVGWRRRGASEPSSGTEA